MAQIAPTYAKRALPTAQIALLMQLTVLIALHGMVRTLVECASHVCLRAWIASVVLITHRAYHASMGTTTMAVLLAFSA